MNSQQDLKAHTRHLRREDAACQQRAHRGWLPLSLPRPAIIVVRRARVGGQESLPFLAAGAAAPQQPVHGSAGRGQVFVPGPLEERQLGLGVEVLAPAELVSVHLAPVRDQHLLQRNDKTL